MEGREMQHASPSRGTLHHIVTAAIGHKHEQGSGGAVSLELSMRMPGVPHSHRRRPIRLPRPRHHPHPRPAASCDCDGCCAGSPPAAGTRWCQSQLKWCFAGNAHANHLTTIQYKHSIWLLRAPMLVSLSRIILAYRQGDQCRIAERRH